MHFILVQRYISGFLISLWHWGEILASLMVIADFHWFIKIKLIIYTVNINIFIQSSETDFWIIYFWVKITIIWYCNWLLISKSHWDITESHIYILNNKNYVTSHGIAHIFSFGTLFLEQYISFKWILMMYCKSHHVGPALQ